MKFIETMYADCLLNISEIVSIFEIVRGCSDFPYEHTINDVKDNGVYAALKIGQKCHSLPLVTIEDVIFVSDVDLNADERERYLDLLKSDEEQQSIIKKIVYELMWQMERTDMFVDTWDVVLTCIRKRNVELFSETEGDDEDDELIGEELPA